MSEKSGQAEEAADDGGQGRRRRARQPPRHAHDARRRRARAKATPRPPRSRSRDAAEARAKPKAGRAKPKAAAKPSPRPPRRRASRPRRTGRARCARARPRSPSRRSARAPSRPSRASAASSPPTGTELVTTAIQAAGELAQIGLTVGGQVLKRAVEPAPQAVATASLPRRRIVGLLNPANGGPIADRSEIRGGESAGSPAVALLSLREPVSSPRRHRRKLMRGSLTRIVSFLAALAAVAPATAGAQEPAADRRRDRARERAALAVRALGRRQRAARPQGALPRRRRAAPRRPHRGRPVPRSRDAGVDGAGAHHRQARRQLPRPLARAPHRPVPLRAVVSGEAQSAVVSPELPLTVYRAGDRDLVRPRLLRQHHGVRDRAHRRARRRRPPQPPVRDERRRALRVADAGRPGRRSRAVRLRGALGPHRGGRAAARLHAHRPHRRGPRRRASPLRRSR